MKKEGFLLACQILILSGLFCFTSSPFLEAAPPEIYSIDPNTVCTASSTQVTIHGAGFQPTPKVSLYGGEISLAGTCDTPYSANDIYIQGLYAYVADGLSGLQVIDISKPQNPSIVGQRYTQGTANGVYVQGAYAYMAYGPSGLQVINISNPANPSIIGSCDTPGSASGVYIHSSYAYIADGSSGLRVIDISSPSSPSSIGSFNTPGFAFDVYVQGSFAYVANGYKGLRVIDISTPANPSEVGSYDTPGSASKVYVQGSFAYVADSLSGLQIIDISDPSNPSFVDSYDTPGSASGVYVQDAYAYVADKFSGLQVIEILKNLTGIIYIDPDTIKVTIPAGLNPDTYSIYITNPDKGHIVLKNAFTITGIEILLSSGLNIFGHPTEVMQGYTSFNLVEALGNGDEICNIQRYDPDTRSYETTAYDPNGVIYGKEFNIIYGEGYIVNMKNAKPVSFSGIIAAPGISCKKGFNIISIPCIPSGYTSYNLLSYMGLTDEIASITRFNSETGIYETTSYYYGRPSGIKFSIINGEAYLIYMNVAKNKDAPN